MAVLPDAAVLAATWVAATPSAECPRDEVFPVHASNLAVSVAVLPFVNPTSFVTVFVEIDSVETASITVVSRISISTILETASAADGPGGMGGTTIRTGI